MAEGPLLIIGGHEDKEGDLVILKEIARHAQGGRLVVATVASSKPEGYFETYSQVFNGLGLNDLAELYVEERSDSATREALAVMEGASAIYFTGGDQLRITSQIGDTPIERRIIELHQTGALIAGTSAGASVMSETMLVKGPGETSQSVGEIMMAPGLGLIRDVIIDQHFAERGRHGRLLGAVAHNPRLIGIGLDEDTAMLVAGTVGRVLGAGAVYLVDAEQASHSNIAEARREEALSFFDVTMHVLAAGDRFDLTTRRPQRSSDRSIN